MSAILAVTASGQFRRGVNIAGAEFGNKNLPGTLGRDYTFNSENTFKYFAGKKLGLMRIALQWERLQPELRGPLDAAYLANVKRNVTWARAHGGEVILEIHNFGRYSFNVDGVLQTYAIDNPGSDGRTRVTTTDLADFWVRMSNEFKFDPTVYAYNLMNEPHDMGRGNWKATSQAVLDAIRANQDDKLALIPGDSWSSGNRWMTTHGPSAWIEDPANNFAYEAHQYFDRDESGTYATSYDAELVRNPDLANVGRARIRNFIEWCRANSVRGMVGEYGIPDSDPRWATVLENFFAVLDEAEMDGAYWAAGEWWGSYALSVQPTADFTLDRPQMANLLAHAPGGYLTALSAASVSVVRATAESLVTVYGSGFSAVSLGTPGVPYPQTLGDVTVEVRDGVGAIAQAGLLYVSPNQVNFQMPAGLATGRVRITVKRGGTAVAQGSIHVAATGPAIFTANSIGYGLAAAHAIRVKADGSQSYEPVVQLDASRNVVAAPIDLGAPTDRVFLALYGTGVRGTATVRIGESDLPAIYAGPQRQYPGLDQINVELPRTFAAAGQVNVVARVAGVAANTVTVAFK